MPTVHLPYINIALDSFALLVALIIFSACLGELSDKKMRPKYFLPFVFSIIVALIADIIGWLCEGHISMSFLTVTANTVASCFGQLSIICFMGYLKNNLYENSRAAAAILVIFKIICGASVLFSIGNAFFGYSFSINEAGHYHHTENVAMGIIYMLFPMLSFFTIVLMALFARSSTKVNRLAFLIYTVFPVAGIIIDYTVHGLSLTYVGLTVSALVIYTSIYLKKQKMITAQRNALMLSQINPHFMYNTLSTIAAMCDVSPNQAKYLTIDFSRYLRQNLDSMSKNELIPFEQELEHVECYLKIEKARFRERLNVIYSIQCKDFDIPPLSIQPLVENAVKHGITKKAEGGTIRISTYDIKKHHVIEIIDDGVGFNTSEKKRDDKTHIGLTNVQDRIAALCHGELTVKSTERVGTRVTIKIRKRKRGKRR